MAESFVRDPSLEKLNRLRKDELVEAGKRLELEVRPAMRKSEVRRIILEHLVDNDICEESALDELAEVTMSTAQLELEKAKIMAEMEIEKARIEQETRLREFSLRQGESYSEGRGFDVAKHVRLVPKFDEENVDQYFSHFEKTAINLEWPQQFWSMLLQTTLHGKAQRVYASLSVQECADYETVKRMILQGYELVPEVYRQRFRACSRGQGESHVEFANKKEGLLDRWCAAMKVDDKYENLRQLVLVEEFLKDLPEDLRLFLNERKANSIHEAAKLADEYTANRQQKVNRGKVMNEREARTPLEKRSEPRWSPHRSSSSGPDRPRLLERERVIPNRGPQFRQEWGRAPPRCFNCNETGHLRAQCPKWREANAIVCVPEKPQGMAVGSGGQRSYEPYVSGASVATINGKHNRGIKVLRDTGASHSLIKRAMLPDRNSGYTGRSIAIRGLENKIQIAPVYRVNLKSKWKRGMIEVAAIDEFPIQGISMILGNDFGTSPWNGGSKYIRQRGNAKPQHHQNNWRRSEGKSRWVRPSETHREYYSQRRER